MRVSISAFFSLYLLLLAVTPTPATETTVSCCLKTTETKVPFQVLRSYYLQQGACSVTAIQFLTAAGRTVCSHPSSAWAQKAMKHLEARKGTSDSKQTCEY